jgi:hypothetical protein
MLKKNLTAVNKASANDGHKTTIPIEVIQKLDLSHGDTLLWSVSEEKATGQKVIHVRKAEIRE